MKKIFMLACAGALVFALTACGNKNSNVPEAGNTENTENTAPAEPETPVVPDGNVQEPAENQPADDVQAAPGEEMRAIRDAVAEALGENYWPNMQISAEILESLYGVTSDMYEDYVAEMPMISANVDTLLIIKAKSDKVEAVEEALNNYREALVNDTMQYPMNLGKIQASRIETIGDYVCFVQLGGDTTAVEENGEEAVILHCQEQNELAIEVISQSIPQ